MWPQFVNIEMEKTFARNNYKSWAEAEAEGELNAKANAGSSSLNHSPHHAREQPKSEHLDCLVFQRNFL